MRFTQEHETRTVVAGQEYHAQSSNGACHGCALFRPHTGQHTCLQPGAIEATPCTPNTRADRSSIIWVQA